MNRTSAIFRTATTELAVGLVARVVGTLCSLGAKPQLAGDIVEVRLDKMARPADWLKQCAAIEAAGKPVLLTVRLRAEGGDWESDDDQRLEIYRQALRALAAVDVELASGICGAVVREAARLGKATVLSFHDFEKTPSLTELCGIVGKAHAIGSIAKVSTMLRQEGDAEILRALLRRQWEKPLCVIGMGEAWSNTRIEFAKLGSCLTYGYLDKPAAPGQLSAAELARLLAA